MRMEREVNGCWGGVSMERAGVKGERITAVPPHSKA